MKWPRAFVLSLAFAGTARAGGFEVPDVGTEALGRGGAFTAKADDATAFTYNVAGFARQRGTRVLFDTNLTFSSLSVQRSGAYPDNPQDPHTPWGGKPYPLAENQAPPTLAPYIGASTDFGLSRFTLAAGVFGPSASGKSTYPFGIGGAPNPARYDVVSAKPLVAFPTVAAAYRVTDTLDVGLAGHAVYGSFDLLNYGTFDLGKATCPNAEYRGCDSGMHITADGVSAAASLGVMWTPERSIVLGANVRTPTTVTATGKVAITPPAIAPLPQPDSPATLTFSLPYVVRTGARYIFWDGWFERADVEADVTYEGWGSAQGDGISVDIPAIVIPPAAKPIAVHVLVPHRYKNTYSARIGGAYNLHGLGGVVSLRAGAYADSSATDSAATRIDVNTLAKYAGTAGIGLRFPAGVAVNLAYAEVFSPERVVEDGSLRVSSASKPGTSIDASGALLPVVNNGTYDAHTRIVSVGLTVQLDAVFGGSSAKEQRPAAEGATPDEPAPPASTPSSEPVPSSSPPVEPEMSRAAIAPPSPQVVAPSEPATDLPRTPPAARHPKPKVPRSRSRSAARPR